MRPSWEWSEGDLQTLVDTAAQENLELEFKRSLALAQSEESRAALAKDVSAMANSAGGTIVYGVIENPAGVAIGLDDGVDPGVIGAEWIEQVITSRVQRRIDGVRITPIARTGHAHAYFAVHVPQSARAPHMAGDHRFWKRQGRTIAMMEEYEVRDVARRRDAPDLYLLFLFTPGADRVPLTYASPEARSSAVSFLVGVRNDSAMPAHYFTASLFLDSAIEVQQAGEFKLSDIAKPGQPTSGARHYSLNWSTASKMPVWEGQMYKLSDSLMQLTFPPGDGAYPIRWVLSAPGMTRREGNALIVCDGASARLVTIPHTLIQALPISES